MSGIAFPKILLRLDMRFTAWQAKDTSVRWEFRLSAGDYSAIRTT